MQKILPNKLWALLIALCTTLGIQAQYITDLSQLTSGEYYRIVNVERGQAMTAQSGSTEVTQASTKRGDRYQRWQITKDDATGLYRIYNDGTQSYIAKPSSTSNGASILMGAVGGKFTIRKTTVRTDQATYFNILPEGTTTTAFNNYGGNSSSGAVKLYTANEGGEWQIEPYAEEEFKEAEMFERGVFRLRNRRTSTKYATEDVATHGLVGKTKITTSTGDYSQIWLLAPHAGGGYMLYNMATGRTLQHAEKNAQYTTSTAGGADFYFSKSAASTTSQTYWNIAEAASYSSTGDERSLNYNDGQSKVLGWSFTGDQGSDWIIDEVPETEISLDLAKETVLKLQGRPEIEDGKYYYLVNYMKGQVMQEEFYSTTYGQMTGGDKIPENYTQIWKAVKAANGNFSFQNVASQRYVQRSTSNGVQLKTGTTAISFTATPNEQYRYELAYNFKSTTTAGLSLTDDRKIVINNVSNDGPNNSRAEWILEPIELTAEQLQAAADQYATFIDIKKNGTTYATNIKNYFDDNACTQLKSEYKDMSDEALRADMSEKLNKTLQDMVIKIKNDQWATYTSGKNWEKLYRIRDYKAYSDKEAMASAVRINAWSRVNNPTGITSGAASTPIYVFVDDYTMPAGGKLTAEFISGVDLWGTATTLKKGLNILYNNVPDAMLYIFYESKNGDELAKYNPIKIHVEGGDVNGFFDTQTQSDEDWNDMWSDGLFHKAFGIDVIGKYAMWHMNKTYVKDNVEGKPKRVMDIWDRIVELQIDLMGIHKTSDFDDATENTYPSVYNNHMAGVSATKNYMWSSNGGTFYNENTLSSVLNYNNMNGTGALWGPAHEIGHNNQTAIKLVGTTEVSNNLFSNMVVYNFDKITTRYWNIQQRQTVMNTAWPTFYNTKTAANPEPIAPMNRMFFTLYLYYHTLGNKPDFYQKVFKSLRHDPFIQAHSKTNPTYAKNDYLKFARVCCDAAEEDLTEFFDYWGFFRPCEEQIGDYANDLIINDDAQIAETKKYIASKNYPKNGNILFLDDRAEQLYQADGVTPKGCMEAYSVANCQNHMGTFTAFRANAIPEGYSATVGQTTGRVTIKAGTGAVGYKIYDADGQLQYVATQTSFTLPAWITDKKNVTIVAAAANPVNDVIIYGEGAGIDNVTIDAVGADAVIYDLSGRRVQNATKGIYIVNGKKVLVP